MMIQLVRQAAPEVQASWLVLPMFEDLEAAPVAVRDTALTGLLARLVELKEVTGALGELTALHGIPGFAAESLLLVGLGLRAKFGAGSAFAAGFALAKRLSGKLRDHVSVLIPEGANLNPPEWFSALVEGVVAGTRGPGLCKTEPSRHEFGVLSFIVAPDGTDDRLQEIEDDLRRGEIVGQAINLAHDLVNTPPSHKAPAHLAERIRCVAVEAGINVQVWDEARIRDAKFGGLLGVAAGSENPPAFVVLQYARAGETSPIALVGKGVTFDSGGLSLKPSASMEDMKSDMTGAAVVVAAMQAVARLELPINVTGYLALTENMTGGKAMKLGDVLTMRNGKTVEVLNTDAEGRLILADALSFAVESRPARILDLATLTGACIVALGPKAAGLFSNDDAFCEDLLAACARTGERAGASHWMRTTRNN